MDFKLARYNMVYQQVRTWNVLDTSVLDLLETLPREKFVSEPLRAVAYSDTALPIGHNKVILPPKIIGRMLQSLNLSKQDSVLEIGTGTGYITALLSRLAKRVVSVEPFIDLSQKASVILQELGINNVTLEIGDGLQTIHPLAPFDAILLTEAIPYVPQVLKEQLKVNGRLWAVIGKAPAMKAMLFTKLKNSQWQEDSLFETVIPCLESSVLTEFVF